jgi:iron complex transport system substrate-binding protein
MEASIRVRYVSAPAASFAGAPIIFVAAVLACLLTPFAGPSAQDARRTFDDVLGHRVEWSTPPARIISLSPNLTEILFAIGCDSSVVGVTRFCDYPREVEALPDVGGIVDPSLEAVLALNPDLVLATRGNPLELMESLIKLGIPVYALETTGDLAQILNVIREIGEVTGHPREAEALARNLEEKRSAVVAKTSGIEIDLRPRVYYGELEGALWTAGPGSFIHNLIEDAGGRNVAGRAPAPWCALSLEAIVAEDPQVYLGVYAGAGDPGDSQRLAAAPGVAAAEVRQFLKGHPVWRGTSLGRDPRIFLVEEDRLLRPGPRTFDVLGELARFLHPGAWEVDSGAAIAPDGGRAPARASGSRHGG